MKILLVDDDASVREAVRKVLSDEGYAVFVAADGEAALDQFAAHQIDLLLLDLGLPIKSGWDVFERITRENPFLPIIIITGQPEQYEVAVAAGPGAFMHKPLDALELLRVVHDMLVEPAEVRLRRLAGRGGDVRRIPSRNEQFLKRLREKYEKPYDFERPHHHQSP